jgi:mannose-6-phosphate isomerase-like protein (cupin superfamily)
MLFVPAGTLHNVTNTGDEDMKLITIYSPPAHPDGTVEATKQTTEATTAAGM